jgi:RNA polymerase sigma-70 factor, ECF subfamily
MDVAIEIARHRPYLFTVAYRMLGSRQDAEDVLQEAFLRAERAGGDEVVEPRAWLTRIVSRLALDRLTSARARRESYTGPWLPEPLVGEPLVGEPGAGRAADPADSVTLDEQISLAFLRVLESLSPAERAVYVLHEAFGLPLAEVAEVVGRSPAACRQLVVRARRHVKGSAPRFDPDPDERTRVVAAFQRACEDGDLAGLARVLDENVVLTADGGGVVNAVRRPITGRDRVAHTLASGLRSTPGLTLLAAQVNRQPGLVVRHPGGAVAGVVGFVVLDGHITEIDVVANPHKLAAVDPVDPSGPAAPA